MATRADRLDALQKALDNYTSKEKKRIENEVTFLKAVLKGRTGQETVSRAVSVISEAAYGDMATYLFGNAEVAFSNNEVNDGSGGLTASSGYPSTPSGDPGDASPPATKLVVGYLRGRPQDLLVMVADAETGKYLSVPAASSFARMKKDAKAQGVSLKINLGFRTMEEQEALWVSKGMNTAVVARPGYSTHQMGLSADIFVNSTLASGPGLWLANNAVRYKFYNDVPGEEWHWTYKP